MKALKTTVEKLMSYNPTLLGVASGWKLYEHPTKGDEAAILAVSPDGSKLYSTGEFEYFDAVDLVSSL